MRDASTIRSQSQANHVGTPIAHKPLSRGDLEGELSSESKVQ